MSETRPPGYWMHETSGVLRPAVAALLNRERLTPEQIAAMRAYLRQWIGAPGWHGPAIEELRGLVDGLTTQETIELWIDLATHAGCDPL